MSRRGQNYGNTGLGGHRVGIPAWAMLPASDLLTPLNGIISPSESESKPSPKKLTGLQEYVREQCLN